MADARGLHARLHLHVHQEVLEELVRRVDVRGRRVRAHLVQDVGDQRVALQAAQLVVDRLEHVQPVASRRSGRAGRPADRAPCRPSGSLVVAVISAAAGMPICRHPAQRHRRPGGSGSDARQIGDALAEVGQQRVERGRRPSGSARRAGYPALRRPLPGPAAPSSRRSSSGESSALKRGEVEQRVEGCEQLGDGRARSGLPVDRQVRSASPRRRSGSRRGRRSGRSRCASARALPPARRPSGSGRRRARRLSSSVAGVEIARRGSPPSRARRLPAHARAVLARSRP